MLKNQQGLGAWAAWIRRAPSASQWHDHAAWIRRAAVRGSGVLHAGAGWWSDPEARQAPRSLLLRLSRRAHARRTPHAACVQVQRAPVPRATKHAPNLFSLFFSF